MLAFLVTGQTFQNRRALRRAGGIWHAEKRGYLMHPAALPRIAALIEAGAVAAAEIEADDEAFTPLDGEALRAHREQRRARHRARLLKRAEQAEARADKARARISSHEREFLALGEPVKIGHHSERRHRKLIERADRAFMDTGRELAETERLRRATDNLAPARIAGDAARQRQAEREAKAAQIGAGDLVKDPIYGEGVVKTVNRHTFTIAFIARGFVQTCDKARVELVRKGEPEALPAPKFKPGDLVTAARLAARYDGVVRRRTTRGYSVEFSSFGRTCRAVFSENALTPRADA
ncbi:MAG: DUF3560 domain-containing protein [Hyphomicrobiales bacterium]|nr:DUF3560 domain-containing protein [Hyphomicrobiales bacterium]